MTSAGSARYPGDDYVLPFGRANRLRAGDELTLVTWGAMVHECLEAADRFPGRVDLLDLRTIAPWDRAGVLASVERTGKCMVVHEDTLTAGFGAEIAATVAKDVFWRLDAPVERVAVDDVPMPYHSVLLEAVLPDSDRIAERMDEDHPPLVQPFRKRGANVVLGHVVDQRRWHLELWSRRSRAWHHPLDRVD